MYTFSPQYHAVTLKQVRIVLFFSVRLFIIALLIPVIPEMQYCDT